MARENIDGKYLEAATSLGDVSTLQTWGQRCIREASEIRMLSRPTCRDGRHPCRGQQTRRA